MKASTLLLVGLAALATSCGQGAASKKLADEAEARVMATIKQVLVQAPAQGAFTGQVHTWYQSEVPNIIKLDPNAAKVYQDHAALLQEVATTQPKLVKQPVLTPDQRFAVEAKYRQLTEESAANVQELTNLASSKTTMSEAEQRQFVTGLATKESHQLQLVQYYGRRTQAAITQRAQQKSDREYRQRMFGLE